VNTTESFYSPDPSSETTYLIETFFSALRKVTPQSARSHLGEMPQRLAGLVHRHAHLATDELSQYNLQYACAVLAGSEILSRHLAPEDTLTLLREAFVASGAGIREKVRAALDRSPDAFRALVEASKAREALQFGPTFAFEHERDDDQSYLLNVRRCFWNDFFVAVSRPELTSVLCAFDRNWFEAIVPERHGVRFERRTTLAEGGSHCPFHFFRVPTGNGTTTTREEDRDPAHEAAT
jgi:hypothetical protein